MFGFFRLHGNGCSYRKYYARLCQHHRARYGNLLAGAHSYEATLLYACAAEANLFKPEIIRERACCGLQPLANATAQPDATVAEYCCHAALLLLETKVADNIRDTTALRRTFWRAVHGLLSRQFKLTRQYFDGAAPGLLELIEQQIAQHHELERSGRTPALSLEYYASPTATCFGGLFAGLPKLVGRDEHIETFDRIGRALGAAIIGFDCAVDWRKDLRTGNFNPITTELQAINGFAFAGRKLQLLERTLGEHFGSTSPSAAAASIVRRQVADTAKPAMGRCSLADRAKFQWRTLPSFLHQVFRAVVLGRSEGVSLYCADPVSMCACASCYGGGRVATSAACGCCGESCCE
ncbi:MAG: hypothetical protein KDD69_00565 [Bdellovibrionales bacterium]|nr:hypothetical protein [Bdellovibrionales bacterium]